MSSIINQFQKLIAQVDPESRKGQIGSLQKAIHVLIYLKDNNPKLLAKSIDKLLNLHFFLIERINEVSIQDVVNFYDLQVQVISIYPKILNKVRCQKLIRGSIDILQQVSDEVTAVWKDPPEGFIEGYSIDNNDMPKMKQIKNSVDKLVAVLNQKYELGWFQDIFDEYFKNTQKWQSQFAAMIVISRLSNSNSRIQDLQTYINGAIKQLDSKHSKIQYAALQLLGLFSINRQLDFQQQYFDVLMPKLLKLLKDPVPRVVSQTFECLQKFLEKYPEIIKIRSYLTHLLNSIFKCLKSGKTWLKQSALSLLAVLCRVQNIFGPSISKVIDTLNGILQTQSINIKNAYSNRIISISIEALAILFTNQNKKKVQNYLPGYVSYLVSHKDMLQLPYLISSWSRLCQQYESLVAINQIYPFLISQVPETLQGEQDTAIELLKCLMNTSISYKNKIKKYTKEIFNLVKQTYQNKIFSQGIRFQAIQLMTCFIVYTKPEGKNITLQYIKNTKMVIKYFMQSLSFIFENDLPILGFLQQIEWLLKGFKNIIGYLQDVKIWKKDQYKDFKHQMLRYTKSLKKAYQFIKYDIQNNYQYEDYELEIGGKEEKEKVAQKQINKLVAAVNVLPDIYEQLIKVNDKYVKYLFVLDLCTEISHPIFDKIQQFKYYRMDIASVLIQNCAYNQIFNYWKQLVKLIQTFICEPLASIRNKSVYSLGLVFMKINKQIVKKDNIGQWLKMLLASKEAPYNQQLSNWEQMRHCEDNIVSAIGKLLKYWGPYFPQVLNEQIYKKWCLFLPLNQDKIEGNIQQQYLIELLNINTDLIIKDVSDLKVICQIFLQFIAERQQEPQFLQITKASIFFLKKMKKQPWFKQRQIQLKNKLSLSEQEQLTKLMKS